MRVKLVTTWEVPCGISEHSYYLVESVQAADAAIVHEPVTDLHPRAILDDRAPFDLLVLNYHAGLHSQWRPEHIQAVQHRGIPVLCVFHDTGVPNSDLCKAICEVADAAVVHEPFDDLPGETVHYWRMGVPGWQAPLLQRWPDPRPVLGSIGFPFPWKHYEQLAMITATIGWALFLIAPNATGEQVEAWRQLNPHLVVRTDFVPRDEAISMLAGCDATAFMFVCHNTGQSASVLQGVAARKPVLALSTCRQMRALYQDPLGRETIRWCATFEEGQQVLRHLSIQRVDPGIVALAQQDSWGAVGRRYAELYRSLV
jgi:hypothetical protein